MTRLRQAVLVLVVLLVAAQFIRPRRADLATDPRRAVQAAVSDGREAAVIVRPVIQQRRLDVREIADLSWPSWYCCSAGGERHQQPNVR